MTGEPMKIKASLLAAYRGADGDNASDEVVMDNRNRAMQVGYKLRELYAGLEWYIPHENQEILHNLWRKGKVSSQDIICETADMAKESQLVIVMNPISDGMRYEIDHCAAFQPKWFIYIDELNEPEQERIAKAIVDIEYFFEQPEE